jgi:tetratricopeptide (TPR) repeat protein
LHGLFVEGKEETPAADDIRDAMSLTWPDLSQTERDRLKYLSEDLYSLGDPAKPPLAMNAQAKHKLTEAMDARQSGNWERALDLLRQWGRYLETPLLSYLRGSVWQEAGDYATATLFFRDASALDPTNGNYAAMYLFALSNADSVAALTLAQQILDDEANRSAAEVVQAAGLVLNATRQMSEQDSVSACARLAEILNRVVGRLQSESPSGNDSVYAMAVSLAGFCYEHLGDIDRAIHFFNLGLDAQPNNDALLVAMGIAKYGSGPEAIEYFRRAAGQDSPIVWSYFYLAHYYLLSGATSNCVEQCRKALNLNGSDAVRAELFEWLAISSCDLGASVDAVRALFDQASRLSPNNPRLDANRQRFEQAVVDSARANVVHWQMASYEDVRSVGRAEFVPSLQSAIAA